MTKKLIRLYRAVDSKEFELIAESAMRKFPPRTFWRPIFYPVLNFKYAVEIARQLHTDRCFVVSFQIPEDYFNTFKIRNANTSYQQELWVPSYDLEEFNDNIVGTIEAEEINAPTAVLS